MDNQSKPFVEVRNGVSSSPRKPTKQELADATFIKNAIAELEAERAAIDAMLANLRNRCKHVVAYDIAGFPYDTRCCYSCNASLGTV